MQLAPMANGKDLELALRIRADLKQGQTELQQLEAALEQAGQQAQQTNAQLGATGKAADQLSAAAQRSASAGDALIASLREQIALFGQSQEVVQLYRAAELGAAEAAAPLIQQLSELRTTQQQAAAAAQAEEQAQRQAAAAVQAAESQRGAFLLTLQEQIALFGKSQDEVLRYRAAQLGAADAVDPLIQQLSELRTTQQQAAAAAQAEEQAQRQAAAAVQAAESQRSTFLASLQEQAELQGKSRLEMLEYRAAQLGVTSEAAGYIARLREADSAQGRAGLTAGQYSQAMRMLPMQLTDVATSLASGMPLWMVAIQQGGQVRDSFGGIGNAARAVMGTLSPLAVAISAVVAGAGALLLAYQQGSQEATAYNQALILTGNYAGTSADQLAGMAQRMDAVSGTQRQAAAALAEIAGTGKFAATQIEAIGTAAVAMENATGRAVSDTVAEFARLAEEPAAASAKLNQQYNYLTAAVYQQIRALEQQGDAQGAAQLAIEAYGDAIRERAEQITENLGYLEAGWRAVTGAASEAWDAMLDVGRADTLEQKLAGAYERANRLRNSYRPDQPMAFGDEAELGQLENEIGRLQGLIQERDTKALEQGQQAATNQAGIEAVQQLDKAVTSTASNADKLKARLKEIDDQAAAAAAAGMAYGAEKLEQLRAVAREQYAEPTSAGQQYLENLQRQVDLHGQASEAAKVRYQIEQGLLGELTDAQKQSLIAEAEALDAKNASADAAREAETAAKQQAKQTEQLARQQASYVAGLERQAATVGMTADQVRQYELAEKGLSGALRERAEAALAAVAAGEQQKKLDEDLARMAERSAQLQKSIAQSLQGQREQNDQENAGYGMGQQARERIAAEADIRRQYQEMQDQLNEATPKDLLGSSEYLGASAEIQRGLTAALDENVAAYDRLIQKQGDWSVGASEAFANYMAEAQDIAGQTEQMVGGAMESLTQGIGDSFAQAIVYGDDLRASLQGVAQTIMAELISAIVQMGIRWAINAALGQAMSAAATASSVAMANTLAAAWAPAAAAASLATGGTNSVGAIAGITATNAAAMGFAQGGGAAFADGGFVTGPGTGTSDSIPAWLSNGEFVTREAVASQPGALGFLHDFNSRGMAALDDWATRVRHSTGGLAGVPAPSLPAPSLGSAQLAEPAKSLGGATVQNAVNLYAVQDEAQVASMAWSKPGQEHFMVFLQRNSQTVKSILKV